VIARSRIREFSDAVAGHFRPEKIILFGSYAGGRPTEDSDVDLLVIMPFKGRCVRKSFEIRQRVRAGFALDLLVRTPQTIARRLAWGDSFIQEILANGEVLYEAHHS
jgi:predicted nucleotidyltransferase